MRSYEIHMPCEVELTRYRLEIDDHYYYHLDANDFDDRMTMKELEEGETIAYRVLKEVLPSHGISWKVEDCLGGVLYDISVREDTILRQVMVDYFGEAVKMEQ